MAIVDNPALLSDLHRRLARIGAMMRRDGFDAIIVSTNANLLYVAGRIVSGFAYVEADGSAIYFIQRPIGLSGDNIVYIRKPEEIPQWLREHNRNIPEMFGLEFDTENYSMVRRLGLLFPHSGYASASGILMNARKRKTDYEIDRLRASAAIQAKAYRRIPELYRPGMTDLRLQIEIERELRLAGSIGFFRMCGGRLEMLMGSLLTGSNADAPSPYDFAMGGAGQSASLPMGADGSPIAPGQAVMIDLGGNADGMTTDMTRTYCVGQLPERARKAHALSIEIARAIAQKGKPGTPAAELYDLALDMATRAGLADFFMGHRQQASFVGHGTGIEVNELPVLHLRSRDLLCEGNVIAVEPKFVIPEVGAVGIENTYVVRSDGMENLTPFPEEMIQLD